MMAPLMPHDFVGKRFGMLIAKRMFRSEGAKVECLCDCGIVKIVNASDLKAGDVKSCGCLRTKTFNETFTKHGCAKKGGYTKEYLAWRGMNARCSGNCSPEYYLEKGITVSPEWVGNFSAFLSHIGPAPTKRHSLDRIDGKLGYQPGNVRWATPREQARNRSNGVYVTVDGERMLLVEAAEKYLISASIVRNRLRDGWPGSAAVKTPKRTASRPIERTR